LIYEIRRLIQALPLIAIAMLWNGFKIKTQIIRPPLQPTALGEKLADSIPQKRLSRPTKVGLL